MVDALVSSGIAQEYEVLKKPLFVLSDDLWLSQSTDLSTYVSDSLVENIMLVTNGNIGLRCKTETETVEIENEVLLHGVYHRIDQKRVKVDVGAIPCSVSIDFRVDGTTGTLSHSPSPRLSLRDGTFHRSCEGVMNSDGSVVFDYNYYHVVSTTDPSMWSAEVVYHNFSSGLLGGTPVSLMTDDLPNPLQGASSLQEGSDPLATTSPCISSSPYQRTSPVGVKKGTVHTANAASPFRFSSKTLAEFTSHRGDLTDMAAGKSRRQESTRILQEDDDSGSLTQKSQFPERYQMECVVTLIIPKKEWKLLQMRQRNDTVVQQSLTSSCMVANSMEVKCVVEGGSSSGKVVENPICFLPGERKQRSKGAGGAGGGGTLGRMSAGLGAMSASALEAGTFTRSEAYGGIGSSAGVGAASPPEEPEFATEASVHGFTANNAAGEATERDGDETGRVFKVQKSFTFWYDEADPFQRVTLHLSSSHLLFSSPLSNGDPSSTSLVGSFGTPFPPPFSFLKEIQQATAAGFADFLNTCEVQLELDDEPRERTQLALRYSALRMYLLSKGIRRGVPLRVGGTGDGLLFDLGNYTYYGLYYGLTQPDAGVRLLLGLYDLLDRARENAREFDLEVGAIFPLRTIRGGECMNVEGSICFVHVNAELGNLIHLYFTTVEEDPPIPITLQLMELMLETSRIWLELGVWLEDSYTFCVRAAMGADMYNQSAWGNFYISLSAKKHMEFAVSHFIEQEKRLGKDAMNELLGKIQMTREELWAMESAAKGIVLERSVQYPGVFPVHDTFDGLHPWRSRGLTHPLFLNYHPLAVYRSKVVDVPDVLLGILLYPDNFLQSDLKTNLEYYLPLCTFDSPESLIIAAICHCRAYRNFSKPMPYYRALSHLNLDNIMYCSEEGLNYVSIAGSYLTVLLGLGGVAVSTGTLRLNPVLPAGVSFCLFHISWKGARLRVSIHPDAVVYELVAGTSIRFLHGNPGSRIRLHTGFRSFNAALSVSIPRVNIHQEGVFEGAIVLLESVVHNILEYHYVSWHRTFERLFNTYRTLHNITIPPLNPEEFIEQIVYAREEDTPFTGINHVLRARNIHLELGTPEDAEIVDTLYGLGNANLAEIMELFQQQPPTLNPDILLLLKNLSIGEVPLAVVSYNRNVKLLLELFPELSQVFITTIDGNEVFDAKLRGQPHIDIFLRAAKKIHVSPSRCLVISYHLDRGYDVNDLAQFFMFLDIEDPFVSSRVAPHPYPLLSPQEVEKHHRENPLICPIYLASVPKNIDELEDAIQGE